MRAGPRWWRVGPIAPNGLRPWQKLKTPAAVEPGQNATFGPSWPPHEHVATEIAKPRSSSCTTTSGETPGVKGIAPGRFVNAVFGGFRGFSGGSSCHQLASNRWAFFYFEDVEAFFRIGTLQTMQKSHRPDLPVDGWRFQFTSFQVGSLSTFLFRGFTVYQVVVGDFSHQR